MQDGADEFGFGEEIGGRLENEVSVRWRGIEWRLVAMGTGCVVVLVLYT